MDKPIRVEITDHHEFHCFRLVLSPPAGGEIEVMLHARSLVNLIHDASIALSEWQAKTSSDLIQRMLGISEAEARARGLIA